MLLGYKDPRPVIGVSFLVLIHHITLNLCQDYNLSIAGQPIVVFETGSSWFVTFLHALFVIPSTVMFARIASIGVERFLTIETNNIDLNHLVVERTSKIEKQNEKIKNQLDELDSFSRLISHDLKTPVRGILNYVSIIEEDFEDKMDPELHKAIKVIKKNGQHMEQLTKDIIAYSFLGKTENQITQFDLLGVFEELNEVVDFPKTFCLQIPTRKEDNE